MDYATISARDFAHSLSGISLNLLVRDVPRHAAFLSQVFGMTAHRVSADFAIMAYGAFALQLHSDASFASHPLAPLLPEAGARGAGIELRLPGTDPDTACALAEPAGGIVLAPPRDKPGHGLREAVILDPDGYAWVPSRPI